MPAKNQNEWKSFNLPTQTWKNHIVFAYFWMFYPKLVHFFVCFLEKSLLSFREKSYFFEKNVISRKILFFFRKRQDFLMIITACSQCQPVEKFWLEAALGKMWRNFVFLQNSLFSWKMWRKFSLSQKILNFLEKSLLSFWENVEKILSFSPKLRFFLKINFFIKIC